MSTYEPPSIIAPCALLTGATGSLGRPLATAFAHAGWAVKETGHWCAEPPRVSRLDCTDEEEILEVLDHEL